MAVVSQMKVFPSMQEDIGAIRSGMRAAAEQWADVVVFAGTEPTDYLASSLAHLDAAIDRHGHLAAGDEECELVDRRCYEVAPGNGFPEFRIDGVNCSLVICHHIGYQEALRQYVEYGGQVHLHLFYGLRNPGNMFALAQYCEFLMITDVDGVFISNQPSHPKVIKW